MKGGHCPLKLPFGIKRLQYKACKMVCVCVWMTTTDVVAQVTF